MLIDCKELEQSRSSCGLGAFIRAKRIIKPPISSLKIYASFLNDRNSDQMKSRAIDLYTMKLAWHRLMHIEF